MRSSFQLCTFNRFCMVIIYSRIIDILDRIWTFGMRNSILTKYFHEFFTPILFFFLTIFLVKSKLSLAKKSKTTTFSRVFHPPKIDNFLRKSKLNFWTQKCTKKTFEANIKFSRCLKIQKKNLIRIFTLEVIMRGKMEKKCNIFTG